MLFPSPSQFIPDQKWQKSVKVRKSHAKLHQNDPSVPVCPT